jgi:hypothetical protein
MKLKGGAGGYRSQITYNLNDANEKYLKEEIDSVMADWRKGTISNTGAKRQIEFVREKSIKMAEKMVVKLYAAGEMKIGGEGLELQTEKGADGSVPYLREKGTLLFAQERVNYARERLAEIEDAERAEAAKAGAGEAKESDLPESINQLRLKDMVWVDENGKIYITRHLYNALPKVMAKWAEFRGGPVSSNEIRKTFHKPNGTQYSISACRAAANFANRELGGK